MTAFQLSDPGSLMAQDPAIAEYLKGYDFPHPSEARYGYARIPSDQAGQRVSLFGQAWVPGNALGTVVLLHGYSEHSGNYARLVRDFVNGQYAVITLDLRGHGLSEGAAGHVDSPTAYVEDTEAVINTLFPQILPHRPLFLWGHSMGGMIALQLVARAKLPALPKASVLSSPLLGFPELHGAQKVLAALSPMLAKLVPTLPVAHGVPPHRLSHDLEYLSQRAKDPLIKKVTTPRWFESVKVSVRELQQDAAAFSQACPTLLMLAGAEQVTNLGEARRFASAALSLQRHKVIEFPGFYHELEKEPEIRSRVLSESLAWFRSHS